jgi:putative transposase
MNTLDPRQFYCRHLPHIVPPDSTFFVTFRLVDSIPTAQVRSYRARLEWLEKEMTRVARLGDDPPEATAHLERSPEATAHLERSPEATAHLERSPEATAHLERSPEATAHLERSPEATAHFERSPEATAHLERSPEATAHLERLLAYKREWFVKFEDLLHRAQIGPEWLKDKRVAKIVADSLHFLDGRSYTLDAYCVMSNHVHAVFKPFVTEAELREAIDDRGRYHFESNHPSLARIMKSIKGYTAREANRVLGRRGHFWHAESYDHYVRDAAEYGRIVKYVLNNPVKAGLVGHWQEWEWNYRKN